MRILPFLFAICISFPCYSQVTGGKIIVFDDLENTPFLKNKVPRGDYNNLIKIGLLSPIRGVYEVGYERLLPHGFSLEGFIGYAHRDLIYERFNSNGMYKSSMVKTKGGFSTRLAVKYYPFSQGWFSGMYIANEAAYRKYNFNASLQEMTTNGKAYDRQLTIGYEFTELKISIGQNLSNANGRLFVDYRLGLIFRMLTATYPEFMNSSNGVFYNKARFQKFGPAVGFNIMAGYAF